MIVVVINEFAEDPFEMATMKHQHPVEALPAHGANEPIGERVRTRRSNRSADHPGRFGTPRRRWR